jgi:putative Holliday junction resolvase
MKGGRPVGEQYEDDIDVIVLTDEDGKEHEFELIEILEIDEREYAVLAPLDGESDADETADEAGEDEAIILRVETDKNGDRVFSDIEDDAEWEKVAEAWEATLDAEETDDPDQDDGSPSK